MNRKAMKFLLGVLAIITIIITLLIIFKPTTKERPAEISENWIKERVRLESEFQSKYEGNWSISWNDETNTPRIYGNYQLYNATEIPSGLKDNKTFVEKLARDFILENKELLGVEVDNFRFGRIEKHRDNWLIDYPQYYKNLPLYDSSGVHINTFGATITEDFKLIGAYSDFYRNVKDIPITPQITEPKAIESANKQFGEEGVVGNISLVILPVEKENGTFDYRLVQRVELSSEHFERKWAYFIDARNGELLRSVKLTKSSMNIYGTVQGKIRPEFYKDAPKEGAPFKDQYVFILEDDKIIRTKTK